MANKKGHSFEQLIYNKDLKKVPLAFRFLVSKNTDYIGELYKQVKFSSSVQLQTKSLNNYVDYVPLSNILIINESELNNKKNDKLQE